MSDSSKAVTDGATECVLSIKVPKYVIDQLRTLEYEQSTTRRASVLGLFKKAGLLIEDCDLVDRRR